MTILLEGYCEMPSCMRLVLEQVRYVDLLLAELSMLFLRNSGTILMCVHHNELLLAELSVLFLRNNNKINGTILMCVHHNIVIKS